MKSLILMLLTAALLQAQVFKVGKVNGKVYALKGTSEKWVEVKQGDLLSNKDMISTDENSFIQLSNESSQFMLKNNSALNLKYIKKISVKELLLALAMEEVKNAPKYKNGSNKNTAVYGSDMKPQNMPENIASSLGLKKISGARQLAESGFKESSVIAARETFRKYPETQQNISQRIYFAGLMDELGLYDEALSEFTKISAMKLSPNELNLVKSRIEKLKNKPDK